MRDITIELIVFAIVFGAVLAAYAIGQLAVRLRSIVLVARYSPPVEIMLEYRNAQNFESLRRVKILKVERHYNGHLYLLGLCAPNAVRNFRVDRIKCIATQDGVVLDTKSFLTDQLKIPGKMLN